MPDALWAAVRPYLDSPVVLVPVLIVAAYMAASKRLAQISGPIGAVARWWNSRQVEKVKRERALWSEQHARDLEENSAELAQLRTDVDWLRHELGDMRRRDQLRDRQAREHTAWDNVVVRQLQAAGLTVDDPPPLYLDLSPLHIPDEGS